MAVGVKAANAAAVTGAAIPLPLQLQEGGQMARQPPVVLRATIKLSGGALTISSSPTAFKQQHLLASLSAVAVTAAPAGSARLPASPALARLLLAGQTAAVASSATGAPAYASIENGACDKTTLFHPAAFDSCLQLAAAAGSGALKVPAALGCLHLTDRLTAPQLAAASREQGVAPADQPAVLDYCLCAPDGGVRLKAASLQIKPMRAGPAAHAAKVAEAVGAGAAAPAAAKAEELLYEVAWPAEQPVAAAALAAAAAARAGSIVLPPHGGMATTAAAIAALQAAQLETLGGAMLVTSGAVTAMAAASGPSTIAAAAEGGLHGLLRSVALEYRAQRFGTIDGDALAPSAAAAPSFELLPSGTAAPAEDAYGAARHGGVQQRAVLLPSKTRSGIPPFHLFPMPRGALSSLKPQPVKTDSVAPCHVLLAVRAVGVNFRWGRGASEGGGGGGGLCTATRLHSAFSAK